MTSRYEPRKTTLVNFRLDRNQLERLKMLASTEGHNTVSQYIRSKLLNPSIEDKLNQILNILQKQQKNDEK